MLVGVSVGDSIDRSAREEVAKLPVAQVDRGLAVEVGGALGVLGAENVADRLARVLVKSCLDHAVVVAVSCDAELDMRGQAVEVRAAVNLDLQPRVGQLDNVGDRQIGKAAESLTVNRRRRKLERSTARVKIDHGERVAVVERGRAHLSAAGACLYRLSGKRREAERAEVRFDQARRARLVQPQHAGGVAS